MLFSSQEFIFGLLPIAVIGFFSLGLLSRTWALGWLILVSLGFYAWWRPLNVFIIAPSILLNFALAWILLRLADREDYRRTSRALLLFGVAFNILFLGYFKYINFVRESINDVFGTDFTLTHIILPLGISFITFQKIAFLVDVHSGRVKSLSFRDYSLFVLFFPQLVAGPIVHYREVMPQFQKLSCRFNGEDVAVGLTLFFFGLFKKVVLADGIAQYVSPIYVTAGRGEPISLLLAWMAAVGFTLQIYFDFSGYSDMALGAARLFGIRLPPNFFSPLRASNIIDFWMRWHITLTRFLTAYVYNPLSLWLTRRRVARGAPGFGGRNTTVGSYFSLLALPTMVTMFISGLWHGASYMYVIWGLVHGVYLCINHAWRLIAAKRWPDPATYPRVLLPVGFVLTFVCIVFAMVLFKSSTLATAGNILQGMIGLNGIGLPHGILARLGGTGDVLLALGIQSESHSGSDFVSLATWTTVLLLIALGCPNSLEILGRYEPALGMKPPPKDVADAKPFEWSPSAAWAAAMAVVAATAVIYLSGPSEFLYWQF